jgi:hypothetical protein
MRPADPGGADESVLRFPGMVGGWVRAPSGRVVGRLDDLVVRLGVPLPMVRGLVVTGSGRPPAPVTWTEIASIGADGVLLAAEPTHGTPSFQLAGDELLLRRDVLDVQVLDLLGRRSGRVAEVLLLRVPGRRLEVVGVDIGPAALCRRLGLGRLCGRLAERVVAWPDLHLRSSRGHSVQLATEGSAVHRVDAGGLAELLTRLEVEPGTQVVRAVGPRRAAEAVALAHPVVGKRIVRALPQDLASDVLAELPAHHRRRYRQLLASGTPVTGRRFLRSHGWLLHRPGAPRGRPAGPASKDGV